MGTTNYINTFIQAAEDCPVAAAEVPPTAPKGPTIASLQYLLISTRPYELTSDDVLFAVHATRNSITESDYAEARDAFFSRSQACLRSSPLAKRYGWGIHHDAEGRIALVPIGSAEYSQLAADPSLKQVQAMRSKRT